MTLSRSIVGGLLRIFSVLAAALIAVPVANADPQPCNTTVGQSASQTVLSYLDRHPDVRAQLTAKSQSEGLGTDLIDYLNRHPDIRQALVTLANHCTS